MTKRLYYTEPNLFEWKTEVTSIEEIDGQYILTLKETCFYPTGGGQPCDLGIIDGIKVIDVLEKKDEVFHVLEEKPQQKIVTCKIDRQRRIEHTQLHTGQHLLSAVCIELYDAHTDSFHLGTDLVSIDLTIPALTEVQLKNIETHVNEYIYENHKIQTYFVTEKEIPDIPLRKLPDLEGEIRIVEIEGIDFSACCGTHVSQTGQLGVFKVLKTEKHRGKTRLYFKCGHRALHDYQEKHEIISKLSNKLSTSKEEFLDRLTKLEMDKKELQSKLDQLLLENAKYMADELISSSSKGLIFKSFNDYSFKEIQRIAKEVVQKTDQVIIFTSSKDKKLFIIHNGQSSVHCGKLIKEKAPLYNGKGGGDVTKAQAMFQTIEELEKFIIDIEKYLNKTSLLL